MHCESKSNNIGRYFPVSAKNLTDNTANSIHGHVSTCSRCPENIKASLAYLQHRATLQKAELSGSWKKKFFKRIWDRLHQERAWTNEDNPNNSKALTESTPPEDEDDEDGNDGDSQEDNGSDKTSTAGTSDDDVEPVLREMADLIKAAAVWLSENEGSNDNGIRTRGGRGRSLPGRRGFERQGGMGVKSRRVHF
jgi:hypothetical protein